MSSIFLYGPSGTGKSTIGASLANALDMPFLDMDTEIEKDAGQSIAEIIDTHGWEYFRDLESRALKTINKDAEQVAALGGGTLLRRENRTLAESTGQVIVLEADLTTRSERLMQDENPRPLLTGDLEKQIARQWEERKAHYRSFPVQVNSSATTEKAAAEIQLLLGRFCLRKMGEAYDVIIREGGLDEIGALMKHRDLDGPVLLVSDSHVFPLYGERALNSLRKAGYAAKSVVFPAGERHKTLETVASLWHTALETGLDRRSTIVALGGGVVGDLAGFTAATYMRGCSWVCLPTSLLGMVDASLGGKTGFDLPQGKNLVGAFHSPRMVLADPHVLATLPERELRSGAAEVLKHGVIADPYLYELCSRSWSAAEEKIPEIVRRGMAVKVKLIEEDPFEKGARAVLNFGHTIGHAVEHASGYALLHGEAVSIGMAAEARIAEKVLDVEPGLAQNLAETLAGLGLPVEIPAHIDRKAILDAIRMDKKKKGGVVRFALPVRIGSVIHDVEVKNLEELI